MGFAFRVQGLGFPIFRVCMCLNIPCLVVETAKAMFIGDIQGALLSLNPEP